IRGRNSVRSESTRELFYRHRRKPLLASSNVLPHPFRSASSLRLLVLRLGLFPQPFRLLLVHLGRLVPLCQHIRVLRLDNLPTLAWSGELVDPAGGRHGRAPRVVRRVPVELAHRGPRLPYVLVHPGPELLAEPEGPGHRTFLGAHVRDDLHGPIREPALVRAPVPVSHGVLLSRSLSLSLTRNRARVGWPARCPADPTSGPRRDKAFPRIP